jgi:hypothetical protein
MKQHRSTRGKHAHTTAQHARARAADEHLGGSTAQAPEERAVERFLARAGGVVRGLLEPRAVLGAAAAGGLCFAAASAFGVGELAFAGAGAYVAFRALRHRVSPLRAIKDELQARKARGPAASNSRGARARTSR